MQPRARLGEENGGAEAQADGEGTDDNDWRQERERTDSKEYVSEVSQVVPIRAHRPLCLTYRGLGASNARHSGAPRPVIVPMNPSPVHLNSGVDRSMLKRDEF